MGKITKFLTVTEEEWDDLMEVPSLNALHQWMEKILDRELEQNKITSRARQLQDSQLLAVASKTTLH